jgi:hypothetical protein
MVKFFRYKQIARITLFGNDDLLLNDPNSIYKTHLRGGFYTDEVNTKLMRFKVDGNLQNLQLSNNCKLVVESVFLPNLNDYVANTFVQKRNLGNTSLRMKGINNDTFDSMNTYGNTLIFTYSNRLDTFFNPNPEKLYNFNISSNFLRNGFIEFEIIYDMVTGEDLNNTHIRSLSSFQISFVIYDENEEDLLLKDTDEVNFKLMKPFNNGIPVYQ